MYFDILSFMYCYKRITIEVYTFVKQNIKIVQSICIKYIINVKIHYL